MNIVLAPDSFKGSLSANQAAEAMAMGIHSFSKTIETVTIPVADGGEGTVESLVRSTNGQIVNHIVENPLGRPVEARYGVLGDKETCVIEIAEASGLTLLSNEERNPLAASSYGTGQLINHALDAGFRKFIIGLGGSATNDGGAGILQALGLALLDSDGHDIPKGGQGLRHLTHMDFSHFDPRIKEATFLIASDVDNPFIGPNGASAIFGPQKGATPEMVTQLDENLTHFANIVEKFLHISLHNLTGAGAAGGAGGAFSAFFPSKLKAGIDVVLEATSFQQISQRADLIITGEGKSDIQTLAGKTPFGISKVGLTIKKPVFLISGLVDEPSKTLLQPYFKEIHSLVDGKVSMDQSISDAANLLHRKTKQVIDSYIRSTNRYK